MFLISDKSAIEPVLRADMHMIDGGIPDANIMWLLYACDVPCSIEIFHCHYDGSPSAFQMLSTQSRVQTDPFLT